MKFRVGFISNSSSTSFVIDKADMSKEQIARFRLLVRDEEYDETSVMERDRHFFGSISMHHKSVWDFLKENDIHVDAD